MAESGLRPAVMAAAVVGGATGLFLATPQGRRLLRRTIGSARGLIEFGEEDLGELLEARVERTSAMRRRSGATGDAALRVERDMAQARVREALARDPRVHAHHIRAHVVGAALHLEGQVGSPGERDAAGEVARQAAGAYLLVNNLCVVVE